MADRRISFELRGVTPLLLHSDSVEWADQMSEWRKLPENAKGSKAGDDRSPAFRWLGYCHQDGQRVVIPTDMLQASLIVAGTKTPSGKGRGSLKLLASSGLLFDEISFPLLVNDAEIPWATLWALHTESDFQAHCAAAKALGFELHIKRATIGTAKHVRVRPQFTNWAVRGSVLVIDKDMSNEMFGRLLTTAGSLAGLGDWRPSSPRKPGPFGRFTGKVLEIANG